MHKQCFSALKDELSDHLSESLFFFIIIVIYIVYIYIYKL